MGRLRVRDSLSADLVTLKGHSQCMCIGWSCSGAEREQMECFHSPSGELHKVQNYQPKTPLR